MAIGGRLEKSEPDNTVDQFKKILKENWFTICITAKNGHFSSNKVCKNPEYEKGVDRLIKILRCFYSTDKRNASEEKIKQFQEENAEFASENFKKFMSKAPRKKEQLYDQIFENSNGILMLLLGKEKEKKKKKQNAITTLENLEQVLPGSGFHVHCSCEEIREVAEDYRYVKYLRNMVNHANAESVAEDKLFLEYLYDRGYKTIEEMSLQDIKKFIKIGAKRIEALEKN